MSSPLTVFSQPGLWLALTLAACSGGGLEEGGSELAAHDPVLDAAEEDPSELTRALPGAYINVQRARSAALDDSGESSQAMANFLPGERSARSLALAGLVPTLPPLGTCALRPAQGTPSLATLKPLELLEAGTVSLNPAGAGTPIVLAPRAFPTVAHFAAGIVYTTRNREGATLPGGTEYTVVVTGSRVFPALELSARAPAELAELTLNGEPLASAAQLALNVPADFTWSVGSAGDLVYVELAAGRGVLLRCAYDDSEGVGSVPRSLLEAALAEETKPVDVIVHRYSELRADGADAAAAAEIRFDFEVRAQLRLVAGDN